MLRIRIRIRIDFGRLDPHSACGSRSWGAKVTFKIIKSKDIYCFELKDGAGTRFLISKFLITKFLITKFLVTKFLSNKVRLSRVRLGRHRLGNPTLPNATRPNLTYCKKPQGLLFTIRNFFMIRSFVIRNPVK
jgi:hypothetical protein